MESILPEKGLQKSDLQVNLKKDDIDMATSFIGRDWYSFGERLNLQTDELDEIKENHKTLKAKKAALLFVLMNRDNIRYEDIVYSHYKLDRQSESIVHINHILDFLVSQRTKRGTT